MSEQKVESIQAGSDEELYIEVITSEGVFPVRGPVINWVIDQLGMLTFRDGNNQVTHVFREWVFLRVRKTSLVDIVRMHKDNPFKAGFGNG